MIQYCIDIALKFVLLAFMVIFLSMFIYAGFFYDAPPPVIHEINLSVGNDKYDCKLR